MSAAAKKRVDHQEVPFGVKQHVSVKRHQGIGNPKGDWNWKPAVPTHQIQFDDSTASQRTRTNTQGIADVGEYY